jgi:hypothetical protein
MNVSDQPEAILTRQRPVAALRGGLKRVLYHAKTLKKPF